jgi:hypothetical protein
MAYGAIRVKFGLGISVDTGQFGKRVLEHGTPELVTAVERGEVAVSAAADVATLSPSAARPCARRTGPLPMWPAGLARRISGMAGAWRPYRRLPDARLAAGSMLQ